MKYSIRDLFWLTLVVGLCLAYWRAMARTPAIQRQNERYRSKLIEAKEHDERLHRFYYAVTMDREHGVWSPDCRLDPRSNIDYSIVTEQPAELSW